MTEPELIQGDLAVDDRGTVSFVNGFRFSGVKRFYVVTNHQRGRVRAWHAHREEAKFCYVVQGAVICGAVWIDNWDSPNRDSIVHRFVLSAHRPAVLYIPPGYANGFMSLEENTTIIFYSTATLDQSAKDDVRYDARYWDIWQVVER